MTVAEDRVGPGDQGGQAQQDCACPLLPVRLELPFTGRAPGLARDFAAGLLCESHARVALDDVCLVMTEMVTNAVRHGSAPVALLLTCTTQQVEVAVYDGSVKPPRESDPLALDLGGRGLAIVEALSVDSGYQVTSEAGKVVWARLSYNPR